MARPDVHPEICHGRSPLNRQIGPRTRQRGKSACNNITRFARTGLDTLELFWEAPAKIGKAPPLTTGVLACRP